MEPDVSIETSCMIRVAVLPIGSIPIPLFRDYTSMLVRHHTVSLSSISSFYTEHQKSPFSHQPWDSGSLRFKFMVGGSPASPWEDFQSNRKILAVLGICHCPSSPDLNSVADQFNVSCKGYSSSLVQRCFAFCPGDSQLEDETYKGSNIVLFPPADRLTQEFHLQTMMQDIAASLLMEFEKWVLQAESGGTILKTPLDSQASLSSEEVIKAKKRRLGRAQKTIGDYCLLAGSPVDANAHYSTALELARLTGDFFWYAGAMEGSVCALLIDRMGQRDPVLEEEVKYRYNSVILHYRKSFIQDNAQRVSPLSFELEATLKLARYLCSRRELAKEVVELLTAAADGAKSLIDASDRLVLYIEIARLFGTLGYHRKAAFFSRQVAQLYLQQENRLAATSAMQVLAMTTKAYRVQSRASSEHAICQATGSAHVDGGKMHHNWIVSLFESQWCTLQMVVLREILLSSVRAGDPLAAWSAAARLLRSYYPLITPAGQNGLASALSNSSERLPLGTRCADPALPFIRLHSFPLHSSQLDIVKRNPSREDWWAGSAPSGPFIYTPFSKGESTQSSKQELIWVVGEPVQVLVELANPCGFDLMVDSIYLSVNSENFDAFPVSVNLPPNSSKVITLSGIPTKVGSVTIPGCIVHCFGVITEHFFKEVDNLLLGAAQGLVLSDPFRCCGSPKLKNISVPSISVVPPLPLLVSRVAGTDGAIILYEGEIREVQITLANAGTVPVEQAHISLSGKNQDSVISIAYETLKSNLPLKPGAEVRIPVTLKAWQLGITDPDTAPNKSISSNTGRQVKDGSSPMLLIHYAGPLTMPGEPPVDGSVPPPGRRVAIPLNICVTPCLSFVKARLLSMEIPAYVGEDHPKLKTEDSIEEATCTERQADKFMKIDPYRGSWGLRFLELELSNPTDVVFEIGVSVQLETSSNEDSPEYKYPRTRVDRDYTARVLIPLEHFKLPVLDGSFLIRDSSMNGTTKSSNFSEKNSKAELNACIKNLISRIKVRWQSGRNSSGELNIKDAIQAALQSSVMDVLLPDPLTFGFSLAKNSSLEIDVPKEFDMQNSSLACKSSVIAHEMTPMEVIVRNNTKETIKLSLSITCRDVAGENCVEGDKTTVLWAGVLNGIAMEVPPLQEIKHSFSLYFLVPGEYTLLAAAAIDDANEILRARARASSSDESIFCRGPPFHIRVNGTH
ncbi:trafficking protein particle complex II-specific subunit 120 homolog isoform X1 [Ipomoea triloba]|uniref:trafficking protein particle complex II-specific subunit 120 homolog isoform X1 n=1 Tax=Ipomoea triloba TaxID=35885 RepID=UPI00125DE023|nr:trafficking protein particle complex II-specific subunit 120 homolog isoform X1 [Ipomoea triloba]